MKKAGLTKAEIIESGRSARRLKDSGECLPLPIPHAFTAGTSCNICVCGRPIADSLHQLELFPA